MEGTMGTRQAKYGIQWLVLVLFFCTSPAQQVDMGISVGEEGVRSFYLTIGDYFKRPEREVIVVHERGLPDEEIPVAFFVAGRAHVAPRVIIDLRLHGMHWMDICGRYRLSPGIFYVAVPVEVTGPPYGRAYGYYRKHPRKQWRTIVLDDDEVVNLVNLRVMSEHYGVPPDEIIRRRSEGRSFIVVNDDIRKEWKGKGHKEKGWEKERGRGKEKGHGKGKG